MEPNGERAAMSRDCHVPINRDRAHELLASGSYLASRELQRRAQLFVEYSRISRYVSVPRDLS